MESAILEIIARRLCIVEDLEKILGIHINEINKYLGVLDGEQKIEASFQSRGIFLSTKAKRGVRFLDAVKINGTCLTNSISVAMREILLKSKNHPIVSRKNYIFAKKYNMKYYSAKTIESDFDAAIEKVTESLKQIGFGVLSRIDIHDKLKEKMDVDFRKYTILGACNPQFAYQALLHEDKIGTMLPCNVIVQDVGDGKVEVAAVDPKASMMAVENENLAGLANDVHCSLKKMVEEL